MEKLGLHHVWGFGCTGCVLRHPDQVACIRERISRLLGPGYELQCWGGHVVHASKPKIVPLLIRLYDHYDNPTRVGNARNARDEFRKILAREVR